jgi:hypothetical protein
MESKKISSNFNSGGLAATTTDDANVWAKASSGMNGGNSRVGAPKTVGDGNSIRGS